MTDNDRQVVEQRSNGKTEGMAMFAPTTDQRAQAQIDTQAHSGKFIRDDGSADRFRTSSQALAVVWADRAIEAARRKTPDRVV
jgi:hypothetical protein